MTCVLTVVGMLAPRFLMLFIFLLTNWFSKAFETVLWPLLGFFFMPYTTLTYMAAMLNNDHNVNGWWLALVIFAVLIDLGSWGNSSVEASSK